MGERVKLDADLSDDSLKELLKNEKVNINWEIGIFIALHYINVLAREGLLNSQTTLEDMPIIFGKYMRTVNEKYHAEKDEIKAQSYSRVMDEIERAKDAINNLRSEGMVFSSTLGDIVKKLEEYSLRTEKDEEDKREKNRESMNGGNPKK